MLKQMSRWSAAFVAWLALAGVAWAGYDARGAELRNQLAQQVPDLAERAYLAKAVDDYIASRNQALTGLLDLVADDSTSNTNQEQKWKDRVAGVRGDLAKIVGDSLKDEATPTVAGLSFRAVVLNDEVNFFKALGDDDSGTAVLAAAARDAAVDNHQKLVEFTANLDEKWRAMLEQDKSLDDGERSVTDDLKSLAQRCR